MAAEFITLEAYNARVLTYEELVRGAYDMYRRYLTERVEAGRVFRLLQELDGRIPETWDDGSEVLSFADRSG